jgi:hypothetical protein
LDIFKTIGQIQHFQRWLKANGYGYLESGVGHLGPGLAVLEIARKAGVRGLSPRDVIADTLPMVQDLIRLRCKPQR